MYYVSQVPSPKSRGRIPNVTRVANDMGDTYYMGYGILERIGMWDIGENQDMGCEREQGCGIRDRIETWVVSES